MDRGLSFRATSLAVMGLGLCLLLMLPSPVSSTLLEAMDFPADVGEDRELPVSFLNILRMANLYDRLKKAVVKDLQHDGASKRGFGIAGLDNVDMITSTLDRSRSRNRNRNHRPQMSLNVDLNQLRQLMAKAG